MKTSLYFCAWAVAFFFFINAPVSASTQVDDDITSDTKWTTAGSPYIISFPVDVSSGSTLTIEPGVVVKFGIIGSLNVNGNVVANGTASDKIYFTSTMDDSIGGDTDEDGPHDISKEEYWLGIHINNTAQSSFKNAIFKYSEEMEINSSNVTMSDVEYFHIYFGVLMYDSEVSISNIYIHDLVSTGIFANQNTHLTLVDPNIEYNNFVGLEITNTSSATISGGNITSKGPDRDISAAVSLYDHSTLSADGLLISGGMGNGIEMLIGSSVILKNSTIRDFFTDGFCGILAFASDWDSSEVDTISLTNSKIINNKEAGICAFMFDAKLNFTSNKSSIAGNTIGVTYQGSQTVDIQNVWWGNRTGPYNETSNPDGTGDSVSDDVIFSPWLKFDPVHPGASNVLFIPGFQGSRLYKKKHIPIIGDIIDKLWEPNANSDVVDMSMDESGSSLNPNIYTKDIIEQQNVLGFSGSNIYKSLIQSMDALVTDGIIADWRAVPYDWRLSPSDVVDRGILRSDDTISYNEELSDSQVPYMIAQLEQLIDSSKNGKVTIVTHSNGGLVAKALMKKLADMKASGENDDIDYIDKVIMVAAPQVGTPKAVASILHGYDQSLGHSFLLKQSIARTFGVNLPGAYSLLPSKKYFDNIVNPVIKFDSSLDSISNFRKVYGSNIDSFAKFSDFLLAKKDNRIAPQATDLERPLVLNELLNNGSNALHDSIDAFVFPSSVRVYQVAGWGLPTVENIQYFGRKDCIKIIAGKCTNVTLLDEWLTFIHDGDNTVVSPSALSTNTDKSYYLDLYQYNNDKGNNEDTSIGHAGIFEIQSTIDLVKNILTGVSTLPKYIKTSKPTGFANLVLSLHSSGKKSPKLSITDKDGKTTGILKLATPSTVSADFVSYINQIPNSVYVQFGRTQYVVLPRGQNYTVHISNAEDTETEDTSGGEETDEPGTFIVREDTIGEDDTPAGAISFPSVPVTPGVEAEVPIDEDGTPGNISVDADGEGTVDTVIPPAPDPEDPNGDTIASDTHTTPEETPQIPQTPDEEPIAENVPPVLPSDIPGPSVAPVSHPSSFAKLSMPILAKPLAVLQNTKIFEPQKNIIERTVSLQNNVDTKVPPRTNKITSSEIPPSDLVASVGLAPISDRTSVILGVVSLGILGLGVVLKFIFKVK